MAPTRLIEIVWIGTDGTVWDLRRGSVYLTTSGIDGFGLPKFDARTRKSSAVNGQTFLDGKYAERDIFLPLMFRGNDVEGTQRLWWAGMNPQAYGTLRVTDADGYARTLQVRPEGDGSLKYGIDPHVWTGPFALEGVADSPLWAGPLETKSFAVSDSTPSRSFFGGGAAGTTGQSGFPLAINPGSDSTDFSITNIGDLMAWPVWTVEGQASAFVAGVDSSRLSGEFAIAQGSSLVIMTDPRSQTAWLDGALVTRQLSSWGFAPIPAKKTTKLTLSVTGTGRIRAEYYPLYRRAF